VEINGDKAMRIFLAFFFSCFFLIPAPVHAAPTGEEIRRNEDEMMAILKMREGLADIVAYMAAKPDLFPLQPTSQRVLTSSQRQEIRDIWGRFLDYHLMIDASWRRLSENGEKTGQEKSEDSTHFIARYAAFLTSYRYALEFIRLADADSSVRIVLNEPITEIGLPAHGYADFKYRFLHVLIASKFALLSAEHSAMHASASTGRSSE